MRLLVALLVILCPIAAHAGPVTFSFQAGEMSGWYDVDALTPGEPVFQDEIPAGMRYLNAVQSFEVFISGTLLMNGSSGNIDAMVLGGEWGEYFYGVTLTTLDARAIRLFVWSAAGDPIITTEAVDAVPDFSYVAERSLFVQDGHPDSWQRHELTSLSARTQSTEQSRVSVPEPATWLLSMFGLGALSLSRHRRRPVTPRSRKY
jgi:hypothetical protein